MPAQSQPRSRMRAVVLTIVIVALAVYLFSLFARVWTDYLWFKSTGYTQVFTTQFFAKIGLFAVTGVLMGAMVGLNMWVTLRSRPATADTSPYHSLSGLRRKAAIVLPAVFFGILGGIGGLGAVQTYLAWIDKVPFGSKDAKFGLDISFYVFDYPWYRFCVAFAITIIVICAIVAVVGHFLNGSFLAPVASKRATSRGAHIHIGILLGLAAVGYGLTKLLDRYGLLLTSQKLLDGLTYTSDHSRLAANTVLAVIAFLTAALFFATASARRWRIPLVSVGLVVVSSLVVGVIYPGFVQSFTVGPTEPDKERPYMEMNIAATRQAYGVADVQISDYSAVTTATAGQLKSDAEALPGIRLMDPQAIQDTYEQLQQVRGYYSFAPVLDVDRYVIDGKETDVVLAAREMDHSGLDVSVQNWNNLHTVYTHGYGLVAAYGNRRQADGEPDWLASDIPTVGPLSAKEPRIYFGEMTETYAIVGRQEGESAIEYDTPGGGEQAGEQYNTYSGTGGVSIGSGWNRLLYAMRFGSINFLLSDRVNSNSRVLYDREPAQRVQEVAPWLSTDSNIYPALVDGKIVWVVDCYTTSANYPNSQRVTVSDAISDTLTNTNDPYGLEPQINYIRNSVKAVVDAYDGSVTLYAWDESDPILQTWSKVYPGSVQPKSAISDELMAHLRYPEDLFKVQRVVLSRYHMTSTGSWYSNSDLWKVPVDPVKATGTEKEPTYYLSIKWPQTQVNGETVPADSGPLFSQTTLYTPNNRENLASYMSVVSEATSPQFGQIRILRLPDTQQIEGPGQAFNSMMANETVSSVLLPYSSSASSATTVKGNLLTIPLGGGLLYVEPIYTRQMSKDASSFPILRFVVVRFGTYVGVASTLQGALDQVFSGDAGATTGEEEIEGTPPETNPGTNTGGTGTQTKDEVVEQALSTAQDQFAAAEQALEAGDLGAYQSAIEAAQAAVEKALEAMNG